MRTLRTTSLLILMISAACRPTTPVATPTPEPANRVDAMQLDPSDPIDIAGWWDNGRFLLEIGHDLGYQILNGAYPDSRMVERGRWTRRNHFRFTLEPYNTEEFQTEDVVLSVEEGVPTATIKGLAPFRKLTAAPRSVRSQLIGSWRNPRIRLTLDTSGSYGLNIRSTGEQQSGRWRLERGSLVLEPADKDLDVSVWSPVKARRGRVEAIQGTDEELLIKATPGSG